MDIDKNGHECMICKKQEKDEALKMFVSKTWGTLKKAAEYRLALKTDCHRETTIEVNMQQQMNNAMYHSKCYRNFTAVKNLPQVPRIVQSQKRYKLGATLPCLHQTQMVY